jgi:hypothetical protein
MRRLAERLLKRTGEVCSASSSYDTQVFRTDIAVQIFIDESTHTRSLPTCQRRPPGAILSRMALDLGPQNLRCRVERSLRRFSIAVEFATRRLKQPDQAVYQIFER